MRKLLPIFLLSFLFVLSTSLKVDEAKTTYVPKTQFHEKPSIIMFAPVYNTFTIGSCQVTVGQTIAYEFDENTYMLIGVYVSSPWMIEIDCTSGPPSNYARSASDMTFSVSNGNITDVSFATTGITEVDNVYRNSTFKSEYLDLIRDNIPTP